MKGWPVGSSQAQNLVCILPAPRLVRSWVCGQNYEVMSLTVSVLLPNGHRKNVKVSPNSVILQALEDICKKQNYDSQAHSFLFQRKILDESLSWRYANVPNNAKLELVTCDKKLEESPVRIALQYEGGPRLQYSFLPSMTLMEILDRWKSELSTLNPPQGHEPSIVYLRQEITGFSKLSKTSLKNIGLTSGSAILRLSFKPVTHDAEEVNNKMNTREENVHKASVVTQAETAKSTSSKEQKNANLQSKSEQSSNIENPITQEMLQNALKHVSETSLNVHREGYVSPGNLEKVSGSSSKTDFVGAMEDASTENIKTERARPRRPDSNETMPKKKIKSSPPRSPPQQDFSNFKFPEESEGMDVYATEEESEIDVRPLMQPCDREAIFFDEKELENVSNETGDPGDEFFELTIDDMRRMLSELRSLQNEADDKPLMTARSRELQRLRSINQYPKIVVRIVFPNRSVLQGIFRPAENVQSLYDLVANVLAKKVDFYLYTTPPKIILKDKKSILYDNHLAPASKVYFGLKNQDFSSTILSKECEKINGSIAEANVKLQSVFELKSPVTEPSMPFYGSNETSNHAQSSQTAVSEAPSTSRQNSSTERTTTSKVPKWFKIGR